MPLIKEIHRFYGGYDDRRRQKNRSAYLQSNHKTCPIYLKWLFEREFPDKNILQDQPVSRAVRRTVPGALASDGD